MPPGGINGACEECGLETGDLYLDDTGLGPEFLDNFFGNWLVQIDNGNCLTTDSIASRISFNTAAPVRP